MAKINKNGFVRQIILPKKISLYSFEGVINKQKLIRMDFEGVEEQRSPCRNCKAKILYLH